MKREEGIVDGWVEIELKRIGHRNHTIRRCMTRTDNTSKFYVDGSEATLKKVQAITQELNIQVDNLCCYLPQEKVYEFAKLDAAGLLKATQKSCGHPKLTEWHERLTREKRKFLTLMTALEADKTILGREQDINRQNERQVRQWEERKRVEEDVRALQPPLSESPRLICPNDAQIAHLNIQRPYAEYAKLRAKWDSAQESKRDCLHALREIELKHGPFVALKAELKEKAKALEADLKTFRARRNELVVDGNAVSKQMKGLSGPIAKLQNELDKVSSKENSRKANIAKTTTLIADLERQLRTFQSEELGDPRQYDRELAELADKQRRAETTHEDLKSDQEPITNQINTAKQKVARLKDQYVSVLLPRKGRPISGFQIEGSGRFGQKKRNEPEAIR